jgi:hypothetical protein
LELSRAERSGMARQLITEQKCCKPSYVRRHTTPHSHLPSITLVQGVEHDFDGADSSEEILFYDNTFGPCRIGKSSTRLRLSQHGPQLAELGGDGGDRVCELREQARPVRVGAREQ